MKIVVYGSGCKLCKNLYENTKKAVNLANIEAEIEYITDIKIIMAKGFMTMPVLEINDKVVSKGRVLNVNEIVKLL